MNPLGQVPYWKLFLAVEATGSLALAASALEIDRAVASRTMARLEATLGYELLDRKRKPVALTPRGRALVPFAKDLCSAWEALAEASRLQSRGAIGGRRHIRVSIPSNASRGAFFSLFRDFEKTHPGIVVETALDVGVEGLVNEQADIAIFGYAPGREVFSISAGRSTTLLLASSSYIERHGAPRSLEDLRSRTILLRNSSSRAFTTRLQNSAGESFYIAPGQKVLMGDALTCRTMLLEGNGISIDVDLGFVESELEAGTIVPVLTRWHREPWNNSIACRAEESDRPHIRALMQLIRAEWENVASSLWVYWCRRFGLDQKL